MVTQTVSAVFEHGIFRPVTLTNLPIPEGQQVRLVIEAVEAPVEILDLATQVFEGFSENQLNELEQIILERQNFFDNKKLI